MDNKIPITRLNKFFADEDFSLDLQMGSEYLHGDLSFKLVLFRVDRSVRTDDIYGEARKDAIKFHPPVEFYGMVNIAAPKNDQYHKAGIHHLEAGNLEISVYKHHLEELDVDILYGDYIGYAEREDRVRYYSVINDGRVTSDNEHTIGGYKAFYRTITCAPVQPNEFNGI